MGKHRRNEVNLRKEEFEVQGLNDYSSSCVNDSMLNLRTSLIFQQWEIDVGASSLVYQLGHGLAWTMESIEIR